MLVSKTQTILISQIEYPISFSIPYNWCGIFDTAFPFVSPGQRTLRISPGAPWPDYTIIKNCWPLKFFYDWNAGKLHVYPIPLMANGIMLVNSLCPRCGCELVPHAQSSPFSG